MMVSTLDVTTSSSPWGPNGAWIFPPILLEDRFDFGETKRITQWHLGVFSTQKNVIVLHEYEISKLLVGELFSLNFSTLYLSINLINLPEINIWKESG